MSKRSCATCSKPLPRLDDATVHGFDHRTNEAVFTCRKCLLEAAAQANLVLAHKRLALARLQAQERLTPLVKSVSA